ncbi:hypothetical protein SAMN05192588_0311 [Nonlabens sp. Hel1_33_55]|uniref:hypothetical protein n=1 Tax=Nonlabens sp. Hel1_33_55 TaxID=1336802 RepID=UPI000875D525|nr:hypothetical protein [Nonlabens sp. Hel1_33_55]SCX93054.1 hypothetical protein SAMN05192588_0311 [Nonlabens sp. Hel1_33_55]
MKIDQGTIHNLLAQKQPKLNSTHSKLCIPIIYRIYKKMGAGIRFDDIKVDETLIIDGHHRFISSLLVDDKLDYVDSAKTSATRIYEWSDVEFVEEDWDTQEQIAQFNREDAAFNNISLEKLMELTR